MNETTIPEKEIREAWNALYQAALEPEDWQRCVADAEGGHDVFRNGYLAHSAKHAEEVADLGIRLGLAHVMRDKAIEQAGENYRLLTAAREREEKAGALIAALDKFHAAHPSDKFKLLAKLKQSRAAYDSSRAADEKKQSPISITVNI